LETKNKLIFGAGREIHTDEKKITRRRSWTETQRDDVLYHIRGIRDSKIWENINGDVAEHYKKIMKYKSIFGDLNN